MTTDQVRNKFINLFKSKDHQEISPAPLVLEGDSTTLFTSAGMQPLVPYLSGKPHPKGKRLVNSQPAIRTQDIDKVGDNRHTTYFEMLGNWSLGDYFKDEQLPMIWEFLTKELNLPASKLWVTVFKGTKEVPRDTQSVEIYKKLGIPENKIKYYGVKENWWSRSGTPDKMPEGELGGPDSEIFFEFDSIKHNKKFGSKCHPNCDCGRFLEIGNSVFIQYKKTKDKGLEELPQKNVDFGGGLERLVAVANNDPDIFKIDVFKPFIDHIESLTDKKYSDHKKEFRIIADHFRATDALIKEGVVPSNKLQGYILRRLIRRAVISLSKLNPDFDPSDFKNTDILDEIKKFQVTLDRGLKLVGKVSPFDLFQSYGFPIELTQELYKEKGLDFNKKEFDKKLKSHKKLSQSKSAGSFKGGLADKSDETIKLHTATHLLHTALRKILGNHVTQKGSNITPERLRFDFTHDKKLTDKEVKKVEKLINSLIDKNLKVTSKEMSFKKAEESGALAFFKNKYDEKVSVYSIGDFSKEVCGGPHVNSLADLGGYVRINKQSSASSGVRRVYATLEK